MITCRVAGSLFFTSLRIFMVQTWSNWKQFPDAQSGEHVEAPIGPGVYEVRHTMTGRVVAFGHSANVANSLADLEYRTCAATSRAEAKTAAQRLLGLRQTAWRRRMDTGWATRPN